jgi:hypothetical protein
MTPHVSRFTPHASRSTLHAPRSQHGVALVVTLLLLSIITFMTVTFLVVTRSQKGSVVTETDQAIARLAADTALERAKAEVLSSILAFTNEFNYGLLVSTNYINSAGFVANNTSPTNVNYGYKVGGSLITSATDWEQNIANLLYMPRPPVFIVTNRQNLNFTDFRYYLDLNRNGRYDTNGFLAEIGTNGLPITDPKGNIISNFFVGDPEWIGSLERPEFQHSADNKFVNRYAYIAIPVGNTLDLNYIHNQAAVNQVGGKLDQLGRDFRRDQGVGTWEVNLAAFLADLNTNSGPWGPWGSWSAAGYAYDPASGSSVIQGNAFVDAGSLLGYRYANSPRTLASVSALFSNGPSIFNNDGVDGYTTSVQLNSAGFPKDPDVGHAFYPWSGADNPNHFYSTQELFDESKTASFVAAPVPTNTPTFTKRLLAAGAATNSYDRYTFSRLVSQLGTDSAPEPAGKLNLNYCNVDNNGNVVPNMATNFIPWIPEQFFTNAAIRLLANVGYTAGVGPTNLLFVNNRGVTNLWIQLWPTNFYTPSVHRLLQLAANIYDASTNRTFGVPTATNGFPSAFRPVFASLNNGNQIFISGYQEVTNASAFLNQRVLDLTVPGDRRNLRQNIQMVWGVPLVIGAKKGLPNFNKFSLQTQVQVTRKLQFHRPGTSTTADVNEIDQMFVVGITNAFGVQAWNSYATPFPRSVRLVVIPDMTVTLTNRDTGRLLNPTTAHPVLPVTAMEIGPSQKQMVWTGYNNPAPEKNSFVLPLASGPDVPYTTCVFLSNATYKASADTFVPLTGIFERNSGTNIYVPHWLLTTRTRLRFAVVDSELNRLLDYVNLDSTDPALDLADTLMHENAGAYACDPNSTSWKAGATSIGSMWCTNREGGVTNNSVLTFGVRNQIEASLGHSQPDWSNSKNEFPGGMSKEQAVAFFLGQFTPGYLRQSNTFAAPYQPFRNIYKVSDWQANDPLVHYTIGDLKNLLNTNSFLLDFPQPKDLPINALAKLNDRYEPWGGNPHDGVVNVPLFEMRVKDPVPSKQGHSDHWSFPTNKFPNIGWLGRVHRGTPWQTVYLKSPSIDLPTWQKWSGNGQLVPYVGQFPTNRVPLFLVRGTTNGWFTYDAFLTAPTNDWRMLDLFTTALNDNATRGQLSVNQSGLAAWSAVLGGVVVQTNTPLVDSAGNPYRDPNGSPVPAPLTVQPAGIYDAFNTNTWPPLVRIVNGINRTRASAYAVGTNVIPFFRNYSFQTVGDILAVPELTVASPFLNTNVQPRNVNYALDDAACERIPQQILGLLKCDHTPRFVVYSFGQTLKPADRSLVTSGAFSRLCTNYQVVAEAATRAVLRVDGAPTNSHIVVESFNLLPPD